MIGYLFIALAALFNACMDAWENENYFESVFKHWNQRFWYKRESWKHVRKILGYRPDSWHLGKTLMVCCIAGVACSDIPGSWWVIVLNVGIVWNVVFIASYHWWFGIK